MALTRFAQLQKTYFPKNWDMGKIGECWKIGGRSGEWWVVDRSRVNAIDPYGILLRCDRLTNYTLLAGPTLIHCQSTGICCIRNPIGNTIVCLG